MHAGGVNSFFGPWDCPLRGCVGRAGWVQFACHKIRRGTRLILGFPDSLTARGAGGIIKGHVPYAEGEGGGI